MLLRLLVAMLFGPNRFWDDEELPVELTTRHLPLFATAFQAHLF